MSKTTAVNALPFPEDTDAPNGPAQIKALAEALDTLKLGSRNLKPTIGIKAVEKDLELTTSYQDLVLVGGDLAITPAVESKLLIASAFDLRATTGANSAGENNVGRALGTIRLDTEDQSRAARVEVQRDGPTYRTYVRNTVVEVYLLTLSAAAHTIKMRAKKEAEGGTDANLAKAYAAGSAFGYMLFAA